MKSEVFLSPPKDFSASMEVAACFCFSKKQLLLLQTGSHKKLAGLWGVPAGKLDRGETPEDAVIRETFEEISVKLAPKDVSFVKSFYVRYPDVDFVYHVFKNNFLPGTKLTLSAEHQALKWATLSEALSMDLIPGEVECIEVCCKEGHFV